VAEGVDHGVKTCRHAAHVILQDQFAYLNKCSSNQRRWLRLQTNSAIAAGEPGPLSGLAGLDISEDRAQLRPGAHTELG